MTTALKSRIERLEKEQRFRCWLWYERFWEGLTEEQLEAESVEWQCQPKGEDQRERT